MRSISDLKHNTESHVRLTPNSKSLHLVWALVVAVVGFLLYLNTVGNDYVLDDNFAILKNQFVQEGFRGIPKIFKVDFWYFANAKLGYYRPLSLVSFAIENEFFGNNPHVSHFNNALLYGLTGLMLCLFLIQLFPNKHPGFAFLVSLIFIAHPIHTEVVANIKSRDEILSFLNSIIMLFFAYRFTTSKKTKDLVWSLIFFYLAMLSKETALVGIALVPLFLYYSGLRMPSILKRMGFYACVAAIFFIQKKYFLGTLSGITPDDISNYPYTNQAVKLPTVFHIFAMCLQRLVVPYPLTYDYSYNQVPASHWSDAGTWSGIILFFSLGYFAIKGLLKKTVWGLGLCIIFISLAPSMGFVFLKGGIMAERFLYAPCLGFAMLLVYGLTFIFKNQNDTKARPALWAKSNIITVCLVCILCAVFSIETIARNTVWKDEFTLYSHDVKTSSNSCQVHLQLGLVLIAKGEKEKDSLKRLEYYNQGTGEVKKSLAIHPDFEDAYFQLGFANMVVEVNYDSAIKYYKKAIDIDPSIDLNYNNLGYIYSKLGKLELASYYYNKAAETNPQFSAGAKNAADIKNKFGIDVHEFLGENTKTTVIKNGDDMHHLAVKKELGADFEKLERAGTEFVKNGKFDSAIVYFKKAAALQPNDVQNLIYLANCYGMASKYKEAIKTFETILKHDPNKQIAIKNLAQTYEAVGEKAKAEELRKRLK
jgi:tetratricopeptide (TPR) repeat protein